MPEVDVTTTEGPDTLVIAISGELDLITTARCADKLTRAVADRPTTGGAVVLDMRLVSFCGAIGIRMLRAFAELCASSGVQVGISAASHRAVHRIIELAGLTAVLPVVDDLTARDGCPL